MNILLTASYKNGIFCNGLQQNIVFLAELFKDIGFEPLIAIDHGIDECIDPPNDILILEKHEILDHCKDLRAVIHSSWDVDNQIIDELKIKNPNFKNIHVHYGNRLLADIEQSSWNKTTPITPYRVDEVWVSPHYQFSIPYFKTYYKSQKIFELPYIWSPKFIMMHEKIWNKAGESCRYDKSKPKNIGIFEPNLNITKHCLPSIMIVEELYSKEKSLFNELNIYCTSRLKDANYFKKFMWSLDIQKDNLVNYKPRQVISKSLASESNISLSNQLLNGLNYTYLEALYFDIPLVHNSKYIKSAGYYYPEYDTQKGAEALKLALTYHDQNTEEYKKQSEIIINRYSPKNPFVIAEYKKLLS